MTVTPAPPDTASTLHLALLARGFDLPMRGVDGESGPSVEVDPVPEVVAATLAELLRAPEQPTTFGNPREEAESAAKLLRRAFWLAGITLPDDGPAAGIGVHAGPAVRLGTLAPAMALRLASVVSRGARAHVSHAPQDAPDAGATPARGAVVVDTRRDKVAEFQGAMGGRWWLRPVRGGCEWSAAPVDVRPAQPAERLRADAARANARSRGDIL